jgi:hypothetical protein
MFLAMEYMPQGDLGYNLQMMEDAPEHEGLPCQKKRFKKSVDQYSRDYRSCTLRALPTVI